MRNVKKLALFLLSLLLCLPPLQAGVFSSYDFTFYKTVDDSMASLTRDAVGLDVTGYGYLGAKGKGVYLRLGLQTPFDTILSLLYNALVYGEEMEEELIGETPMDSSLEKTFSLETSEDDNDFWSILRPQDELATRWSMNLTLGPARRSMMGDKAMVYLGTGVSGLIYYSSRLCDDLSSTRKELAVTLGGDLDGGFRIDVKENTTIRIGVHFTADVLGYQSFSTYSEDTTPIEKLSYAYAYLLSRDSYSGVGYIRLATTFRNRERKVYSYSNTTPFLGKGVVTIMEQE